MLPAVTSRSRSSAVSDPSILSDESAGGLTSSTRSTPLGMTTSAPAAGTFPSGQLAASDQRLTSDDGVSVTGPAVPVGRISSSRVQARIDDMHTAARTITRAGLATRRRDTGLAEGVRDWRLTIGGCSRTQATSTVSAHQAVDFSIFVEAPRRWELAARRTIRAG